MLLAFAVELIELHGTAGQVIELNPRTIVTARRPARADHFAPGTQCLITTADGKSVMVVEPCATVRKLLEGVK